MLLKRSPLGGPRGVRHLAVELGCQQCEISERVYEPVSIGLCGSLSQRPVDLPPSGHDVLDVEAATRDTLTSESFGFTYPPATMILHCLQHHPQPASPQPLIGGQ